MDQSTAVWILIGLSLVTANLPFLVERPFLAFPWQLKGAPERAWWLLWLTSFVFGAALVGWVWLGFGLIAQASFFAGDLMSVTLFMGKLLLVIGGTVLLLAYPGFRDGAKKPDMNPGVSAVRDGIKKGGKGKDANPGLHKSFFDRLLELLMFYGIVGVLGLAFEINIGNTFPQRWEFYAVTLCLFVVMGYPGFVLRYLMRHTKARPVKAQGKASDASVAQASSAPLNGSGETNSISHPAG